MAKQKILKIKVGEIYLDGKVIPVFQTYFRKESKKGNVYYQTSMQAFPQEIEVKEKVEVQKIEA